MSALEDQDLAKKLVCESVNRNHDAPKITIADIRLVWFSKSLANWKATLVTVPVNGLFYEVTYNGALGQAYLDTYVKVSNEVIPIN